MSKHVLCHIVQELSLSVLKQQGQEIGIHLPYSKVFGMGSKLHTRRRSKSHTEHLQELNQNTRVRSPWSHHSFPDHLEDPEGVLS